MVVQHNMQAANASRMLNITNGNQSKSTEKLSSGYRINRAADDAAGLSISEKMRKQIKGLDQASTNAQDGVSAVQTAEGALTEVHSMLQRMNELAVQASNGTNSESDRTSIQAEIDQLTTEIDRVAETTKFNETYLLKGSSEKRTINIAAHDAGLDGVLTQNSTKATFTMKALDVGDKYTVGGKEYTIGATTVSDALTALKITIGTTGSISIDGKTYELSTVSDKDAGKVAIADIGTYAGLGSTITFNGNSVSVFSTSGVTGAAVDSARDDLITAAKAYSLVADELGQASSIGAASAVTFGAGAADDKTGPAPTNATDVSAVVFKDYGDSNQVSFTLAAKGTAQVQKDLSFNLHVGADADMTNKIGVNISAMDSTSLGIHGLNVSDASGKNATYAIDAIADAISKVSSQRSSLGAVQNRLEHTIANVDNVVENSQAAESRIRDTDMADEMVKYSANNILAQAGQSMLAQANQATQGVLSLLG